MDKEKQKENANGDSEGVKDFEVGVEAESCLGHVGHVFHVDWDFGKGKGKGKSFGKAKGKGGKGQRQK